MIRRFKSRIPIKRKPPQSTEDAAYLAFVRTLPCAVCGCRSGRSVEGVFYPVESAHTRTFGKSGYRTAPARSAIPLCGYDHRIAEDSYHRLTPEYRWAEHHGIDLPALCERIRNAFEAIRARRIVRQA